MVERVEDMNLVQGDGGEGDTAMCVIEGLMSEEGDDSGWRQHFLTITPPAHYKVNAEKEEGAS